ncbi:Sec-independent protein translocase subunit TatA [Streptomyces sp. NPDC005820]|uniref:Sec-independent protein translocase subunit TatA n=1 Tax=Streptomyces sp. NPDC005820 TaxID=3157069 RepID=UPI0034000FBA
MLRNGLEPWHLLVVAAVVVLVFGSKKLPDTARALGRSMRILKSEAKAMKEDGAASGTVSEAQTTVTTAPAEPRATAY